MKIRNIITTSALVVLLGLSAGPAFADDNENHVDDSGFTVAADANYPGTEFVYENDFDVNEGDILSFDNYEVSGLPEDILETLNTH